MRCNHGVFSFFFDESVNNGVFWGLLYYSALPLGPRS